MLDFKYTILYIICECIVTVAEYSNACQNAIFTNIPSVTSSYWSDPVSWKNNTVPTATDLTSITCHNNVIVNDSTFVRAAYVQKDASLSVLLCSKLNQIA